MKQLIIAFVFCCAAVKAAENLEDTPKPVVEASQPTAQEGAGLLEQLRQTFGAKTEVAQEVRPVVDPSTLDVSSDDQGDVDFDFNENAESGYVDDSSEHQQEELSGEEMSEYFADVAADDIDGVGL